MPGLLETPRPVWPHDWQRASRVRIVQSVQMVRIAQTAQVSAPA
jgi:hypothetical protein